MKKVKEWTSPTIPELLTLASCRKDWERISAESSLMSPRQVKAVKELNRTGTLPREWMGETTV